MCDRFDRRYDADSTYALEFEDAFTQIYAEYVNPRISPFIAVWVNDDGRCMGMTGISSHKIRAVPSEFYRSHDLSDDVSIFYAP